METDATETTEISCFRGAVSIAAPAISNWDDASRGTNQKSLAGFLDCNFASNFKGVVLLIAAGRIEGIISIKVHFIEDGGSACGLKYFHAL